ncbi:TPA: hypothetical protein ACIYHT_005229 [Escherichia coli]
MSIKNDGHYFCRAGGNRPDGLNEPVTREEKNTGEERDVLEFSSLTELKKYRKSHPEKMAFSYSYALSRGVDTQFRHINIAEADHFKQFLRQIKRAGLYIRAIC